MRAQHLLLSRPFLSFIPVGQTRCIAPSVRITQHLPPLALACMYLSRFWKFSRQKMSSSKLCPDCSRTSAMHLRLRWCRRREIARSMHVQMCKVRGRQKVAARQAGRQDGWLAVQGIVCCWQLTEHATASLACRRRARACRHTLQCDSMACRVHSTHVMPCHAKTSKRQVTPGHAAAHHQRTGSSSSVHSSSSCHGSPCSRLGPFIPITLAAADDGDGRIAHIPGGGAAMWGGMAAG